MTYAGSTAARQTQSGLHPFGYCNDVQLIIVLFWCHAQVKHVVEDCNGKCQFPWYESVDRASPLDIIDKLPCRA